MPGIRCGWKLERKGKNWKFIKTDSGLLFEPKQRAQSPPKVPPISMAGGLAAGLASEFKTDTIPYGRRFSAACGGELQIVFPFLDDVIIWVECVKIISRSFPAMHYTWKLSWKLSTGAKHKTDFIYIYISDPEEKFFPDNRRPIDIICRFVLYCSC